MARRAEGVQIEDHPTHVCDGSLRRAFGFLGKRWTGVILATLMEGPASFSELARSIEGISDSVLSGRLSELAAAGLVHRDVEQGPPVAVHYRLTSSGAALFPAMQELKTWATANLPAASCPDAVD